MRRAGSNLLEFIQEVIQWSKKKDKQNKEKIKRTFFTYDVQFQLLKIKNLMFLLQFITYIFNIIFSVIKKIYFSFLTVNRSSNKKVS